MKVEKFLVGDTARITWINTGVTPSPIIAALYSGSETIVDSGTMSSSGNGHYFKNIQLPNTPGYWPAETNATIGGFNYKRRVLIHTVTEDVD